MSVPPALTQSLFDAFSAIGPASNPHADGVASRLDGWVTAQGAVLDGEARERFAAADFGGFAAIVHPTADAATLDLCAGWFAWLFLLDDLLDDDSFGRDADPVQQLTGDLLAVVLDPMPPAPEPGDPRPPIITSMVDLWRRTVPSASSAWRERLVEHAAACVLAARWETANRAAGLVPVESEYLVQRRHTGAIYVCMDLIEIVERLDLPATVYRDPVFDRALDAACDVVCWVNDLYSWDKETALGEVHNLVTVIAHGHGVPVDAAMSTVTERVRHRLGEFLAAEAELRRARPELAPYRAGMRSWMRGNLDWSARTDRYSVLPAGDPT